MGLPERAPWYLDVAERARWQAGVDPATAKPEGFGWWQIEQVADVYGRALEWSPVALSPEEWPDEGTDGAIDLFREAMCHSDAYLVAERGMWSGFPDPPEFSLWRMKADETNWKFLGHFDNWPNNWKRQSPTTADAGKGNL